MELLTSLPYLSEKEWVLECFGQPIGLWTTSGADRTIGKPRMLCSTYPKEQHVKGKRALVRGNETDRDKRTLAEGVDPILVPQKAQQLSIKTRCKDLDVQRVIQVCVHSEIFDLVQRDGLVLGGSGIGWSVIFWISTEGTNINFSGRDSTIGVNLSDHHGGEKSQDWEKGGHPPRLRQRDLETSDCSAACSRLYQKASTRSQDESDTTQ
jgi:hypothetical protein